MEDNGVRGGTGSGVGRGSRPGVLGGGLDPLMSSDEDSPLPSHSHSQPSVPSDRDDEDTADEGQFAFRRNRNSTYLPVSAVKLWQILIFLCTIFVKGQEPNEHTPLLEFDTGYFVFRWLSLFYI